VLTIYNIYDKIVSWEFWKLREDEYVVFKKEPIDPALKEYRAGDGFALYGVVLLRYRGDQLDLGIHRMARIRQMAIAVQHCGNRRFLQLDA